MAMANTLAYCDMAAITAVKCFIVQAPGENKSTPQMLNKIDLLSN
jgi:hypothetical protein